MFIKQMIQSDLINSIFFSISLKFCNDLDDTPFLESACKNLENGGDQILAAVGNWLVVIGILIAIVSFGTSGKSFSAVGTNLIISFLGFVFLELMNKDSSTNLLGLIASIIMLFVQHSSDFFIRQIVKICSWLLFMFLILENLQIILELFKEVSKPFLT
jgi:hypothetical protein